MHQQQDRPACEATPGGAPSCSCWRPIVASIQHLGTPYLQFPSTDSLGATRLGSLQNVLSALRLAAQPVAPGVSESEHRFI